MADISLVRPGERDLHHTRSGNVKVSYLVEREIDLAEVAAKKGSALADGDVVIALKIPARSVIQGAFVAVDEKLSDATAVVDVVTSSGTTLIGASAIGAADAGDIVSAASPAPVVTNTATDFVEVELSTIVADTTGKFRVAIEVLDLTKARRPGLAELGS